jgi:asparagine synthase (glutamine-hydrolysing)
MCGIAGFIASGDDHAAASAVGRMVDALGHRGPDGRGLWHNSANNGTVVLGHTRLAIIDLSENGRQPLQSACGRYVTTFNGEIYNYRELRQELQAGGVSFRTQTDTEVLQEAIKHWGVEAFTRFNGMWALAQADVATGETLVARDRLGVKPLFYEAGGERYVFASEIKALLAADPRRRSLNAAVVARYLQQGLLDADNETFFSGIRQLPAAHYARLSVDGENGLKVTPVRYWSPPTDSSPISDDDAIATVRSLLLSSVELRLRSDVPCGVLLSGGVDSSGIAAAMSRVAKAADVKLLSAVSDDASFDESRFVDRVSAHLKLPVLKVQLRNDASETWQQMEDATWHHDAPLLSLSAVAHLQLMQRAREAGVTVVLSGQGADEVFCGYKKYVPFYAQTLVAEHKYARAAGMLLGFALRGTVLNQFKLTEASRYLSPRVGAARASVLGPAAREAYARVPMGLDGGWLVDRQKKDLEQLSVPSLLHYEDRMSMAMGREVRLPFLDFRIVETALRMPPHFKIRDGWTKWVLRKAIEPWLPSEISWRRDKQGFVNPQSRWLRVNLRDRIEAMLSTEMRAARRGFIDQNALRDQYAAYVGHGDTWRTPFRDLFGAVALEVFLSRYEPWLS